MTASRFIFALVAVALLAPTATASHWLLYHEAGDTYVGETREDDAEVVRYPESPLDGVANKVTLSGDPGNGGLFLDAVVGNRLVPSAAGDSTDLYAGSYTQGVIDAPAVLLPGERRVSAWYGEWNDFNDDGVIDDVHDAGCEGAACGDDEFRWRGSASGDSEVAVAAYVVPYTSTFFSAGGEHLVRPGWTSATGWPDRYHMFELQDQTGISNAEQGWLGGTHINTDGGLLGTYFIVVAAGAPRVTGGLQFNLDHPDALVDVDRYTGITPEVESLYYGSIALYHATDPWPTVDAIVDGGTEGITTIALGVAAQGISVANGASRDSYGTLHRALDPADAKEPNTVFDDFEGRALFGGVGDHGGSYNSYTTYVDGYHLYVDNVARMTQCGGVDARVPGTNAGATATPYCQWAPSEHARTTYGTTSGMDVVGAQVAGERTSGSLLMFETYVVLWKDRNADTHLGNVCEPTDGTSFDAARNTCNDPPYPWPNKHGGHMEHIHACTTSTAEGGSFTVMPQGDWPPAFLVKDVHQTTRSATDAPPELLQGNEPVTLRWRADCNEPRHLEPGVYSRDAILFPGGGSTVPLIVSATVAIGGFKDKGLGIDLGAERVVDVDVIAAMM